MAGKIPVLALRDGLGNAVFNATTKKLDFPSGVPQSRFPQKGLKKGRKVLMAGPVLPRDVGVESLSSIEGGTTAIVGSFSEVDPIIVPNQNVGVAGFSALNDVTEVGGTGLADFKSSLRCLISRGPSVAILYVDSGAGQSLSSCSTAFAEMMPCQVEITGIAGALQIYGCGTALFLARDSDGRVVILRVHNCLYGQGQFNLLSVSQVCQVEGNSVDFTLASPALVIRSASGRKRSIRLPLVLEDGLFAISVTPFQVDDPRHQTLPKFDVTPSGVFRLSDAVSTYRWAPKVLASASLTARILVAPRGDYDCNLQLFCGNFLAPPSIPQAKRQYDPTISSDMVELTTRFLGLGEDRLKRTIALNNGLLSPASKATSRLSVVKPFFPHGRWTEGKTPRVSKGKIGDLHHAAVGEVVFTDTFESGDSKYRYGQAYFDLVSHWGDVSR
jgi:hypothetical protein